jgi:Arc/MetJ family transcription regulator
MALMRTNLVLDDELVAEAMRVSGAESKREVVEVALRALIEAKEAERRRISWRERAARLDARLAGLRLSRRPSELLREDRARR